MSSRLAPYECRVWWATIAAAGPRDERLLSEHEHERRRAYVQPDDRLRFVTGAVLLRRAAATCLAVAPQRLRVDRRCRGCGAQHGKPRLPEHPELDVSVAHTGQHVVVALAHGPRIGVDVERIRDGVDVVELARSAFATARRPSSAALPAGERAAAFYRLWTSKESIVKALGIGIAATPAGSRSSASPACERQRHPGGDRGSR